MFGRKGSGNGCMKGPNDVKIDSEGRYVVADTFNHRVCWFDKVSCPKRAHVFATVHMQNGVF